MPEPDIMIQLPKRKPLVQRLSCLFLFFVWSISSFSQPKISSFVPKSGSPGTTVTIAGSQFNPVITSNIVYFGKVRAMITAATTTSISVVVPFGATNDLISVTDITTNLTGSSSSNFLPSLPTGATSRTVIAQANSVNTNIGWNTRFLTSADFDGDGKPDLAALFNGGGMAVYHNESIGSLNATSFGAPLSLPVGNGSLVISIADMNGDGKLDIIIENESIFTLEIWQNSSVPGTISFFKAVDYSISGGVVTVGDIDGDGRPDIIQMDDQYPQLLKVIKNNSTGGVINNGSLSPPAGYNGANGIQFMTVRDIDGDGKMDIVTCNSWDHTISVFRNTGTPGTIDNSSLAARVDFPCDNSGAFSVAVTDVDGDGRPDLVVTDKVSGFTVLKNLCSPGIINGSSFAAPVYFASGTESDLLDVGDLDGDGKPDLAICNHGSATLSVFKNISVSGTIDSHSFASKSDFSIGQNPYSVAICDFDGDGIPDIATGNPGASNITFFQTAINHAAPSISRFSPDTAGSGQTLMIYGKYLAGTSAVMIGDSAAASFTAIADTVITATVANGSSGKISVSTSLGLDTIAGFTFIAQPVIQSFAPKSAGFGDTVVVYGNHLLFANAVSFGGRPAVYFKAISDTTLIAVPGTAGTGNILVTTNYGAVSATGFVFVQPSNIFSFSPQAGAAGDSIYIHGRYLSTTQNIWFGGTAAASFQIISDTLVLAIVGNGANGDIVLDNIGSMDTITGFSFIGAPSINSFYPSFGPVGTSVTISGHGFSKKANENLVYFGAVRAVVTSANANSLSVIAPAGAGYLPLSVTINGMTSYTAIPFRLTFSETDSIFDASSFGPEQVIPTDPNPTCVSIGDLNLDGKPDLAIGLSTGSLFSTSLSVLENTSSSDSISFMQMGKYSTDPADGTVQTRMVDMDGDGILDVALSNGADIRPAGVFQNTGRIDSIVFQNGQLIYYGGAGPFYIATGDLDGDGRPDIAVAGNYSNAVFIFKNISTGNHIAYQHIADYPVQGSPGNIAISDLDGDGKADLAVISDNYLSVFRNKSTPGNISLATVQPFATQLSFHQQSDMVLGDLNMDGKPDIITITSSSVNQLSVFQNNSTPGNISFLPKTDYIPGNGPRSIGIADFNGDGKPDIGVLNVLTPSISIFRNISSGANISLDNKVDYPVASGGGTVSFGDIDGDGKPEIILVRNHANSISIFKNLMSNGTQPKIISFAPTSANTGDTIIIKGTHLNNALAVSFGGAAAGVTINNTDTLVSVVVGNGRSGNVEIATVNGIDSLSGFDFLGMKLNSFSPDSLARAGILSIRGNHLDQHNSCIYWRNCGNEFYNCK